MTYKLIELFFTLLGLIPRPWGIRVGSLLGRIVYLADFRHRNIAMQNLVCAFGKPPSQLKDISVKVFENMGKILFEMAWSARQNKKQLFRHFRIEGVSHIKDAYHKGRGVLALSAHFGNWELLSVVAAMIAYPLSIVFRPLDFKPVDRLVQNFRTRFGAKLIPKRKSMRHVLRSLKQGDMAALLMDQNVNWEEGVFADFFGHPACTNKGLALLALKTESPVVPVFLLREQKGFSAVFLPEVTLIKTGDRTKDLEANTEQYNRIIESMVRQYPDQWFWVHQRWKTKPFQPWPRKH